MQRGARPRWRAVVPKNNQRRNELHQTPFILLALARMD